MSRKNPSSLDYETLLHELALNNWRRSILEGDFPRARQNATQLSRSRDRFWRWQGYLDLALTDLCQGLSKSAREALEGAKDCFRGVPGFESPAIALEAHLWLETGRPGRALVAAQTAGLAIPLLVYLRGLAHARLGDEKAAASDVLELSGSGEVIEALRAHVTAECHPESAAETLREAATRLSRGNTDPASPAILVRFALASSLFERGELGPARRALDEVLGDEQALLHWPIPFVRAFFRRAAILRGLGDERGARADAERFLTCWEGGDLDRDRVEEVRQWVNA